MLKSKSLPILAGAAALGALALGNPAAHADVFTINSDHCTGNCLSGTGFGGNIIVTQEVANTVDVEVQLASPLAGFANSAGGGNLVLFNLPFSSITLEGDTPTFAATTVSAASLSPDGTGTFNFALACTLVSTTCNGANVNIGTDITFDVTATGITPASFTANSLGNFFSVDVINNQGATGLVDSHTHIVPAPVIGHGLPGVLAVGGVLLFGAQLFGRNRKRGSPGAAIPRAA